MVTSRTLKQWHRELNALVFGSTLRDIPVRAEYVGPDTLGLCWGTCISVKDTLEADEAKATLLHEMVHQWQAEQGLRMDHGASFNQWRAVCLSCTGLSL